MFKDATLVLLLLNIYGGGETKSQNLGRKARQTQICELTTEQYGTCQRWSQCQTGQIAYYQKNVAPIYCKYDRLDPIVCCDITSNSRISRNQRISEKMCTEIYAPKQITTINPVLDKDLTTKGLGSTYALGGVRTAPGEFTHMAALGWKSRVPENNDYNFLCGGTLISDYFVLSAAHCASFSGVLPEIARVGGNNLQSFFDYNIPIANIYVHRQYRRRQNYNDISLIKLKFPSYHKPACLWQTQETSYTNVIALGYGDTTFGGMRSDDLLRVDLSIYPKDECQRYYQPGYKLNNGIIDSHICAGDRKKIQDTCQGDSGGPLMVKVNNTETEESIPYILGVTSFGKICGAGPPSVYTRASSYLDWIESIVWPN